MKILKTLKYYIKLIFIIFLPLLSNNSNAINVISSEPNKYMDVLLLRQIFTRKVTKWHDTAQSITVFIKPPISIEHKIFVIEVLGITSYRYQKLLNKQLYSGSVSHPVVLYNDVEMITRITSTKNSIGYTDDNRIILNLDNIYTVTVTNEEN